MGLSDFKAQADQFRDRAAIVAAAPKRHVTLALAILRAVDANVTGRAALAAHVQAIHPDATPDEIEAGAHLAIDLLDTETGSPSQ